jgi:hypothetical protein
LPSSSFKVSSSLIFFPLFATGVLTPVAQLPPVSTTLAKLVAKFSADVVDTYGKFSAGVVDTVGAP